MLCHTICQCPFLLLPAWSEPLFSVVSVLQAAAGADAVRTGSGLAGTSVGPAAPSGEQAVSHVRVAAAAEPKQLLVKRRTRKKHMLENKWRHRQNER